jgi:SAM-dependent methyltransferase
LSTTTSLIYRNAQVYEALMRALYGRHYAARMTLVAERVPIGASVVELCCGPGTLYLRHLRGRVSSYIGMDVNPRFVARLRAAGADARQVDLRAGDEPLPQADVVLIQASLYHFLPDAQALLDRMLAAARRRVIVAEPIRNLSSSSNPLLARLGRRGTDPGVGGHAGRFTEETLAELMSQYRAQESLVIPGGREKIYVLAAGAGDRSADP